MDTAAVGLRAGAGRADSAARGYADQIWADGGEGLSGCRGQQAEAIAEEEAASPQAGGAAMGALARHHASSQAEHSGFVSGGIMPLMRSTSVVSQNYLNDYSVF
eukprot:SAG22_NODE_9228_length_601_cov_4.145418_1_plen_104_part_00